MAYELKTKLNDADVRAFIEGVGNEKRKLDAFVVLDMMERLSGEKARMWGKSIIGFGTYTYKTKSGCAGDWMRVGFSPRKGKLVLYIMPGCEGFGDVEEIMSRLGKYKTGKSCLYINKLEDVDMEVLEELVVWSLKVMEDRYGK